MTKKRMQPILQTVKTKEMETLKYTTKHINRNYRIKVYGQLEGKQVNTLVGVSGLIRIVGDIALCNKLLDRAEAGLGDKVVCKLRRGIKISFYIA